MNGNGNGNGDEARIGYVKRKTINETGIVTVTAFSIKSEKDRRRWRLAERRGIGRRLQPVSADTERHSSDKIKNCC